MIERINQHDCSVWQSYLYALKDSDSDCYTKYGSKPYTRVVP